LKIDKIIPHLWFEKDIKDIFDFYASVFHDSKIISSTTIHNTPSGDCDFMTVSLEGRNFMFIGGGKADFSINESISFIIASNSLEEVDYYYNKLSSGKFKVPLDKYHFSEKYAWFFDKYGVSWQVIHLKDVPIIDKITPCLYFADMSPEKDARKALEFYKEVFKVEDDPFIITFGDHFPDASDKIAHSDINLLGRSFSLCDACVTDPVPFNEAISLLINCETQEEIDYYWDKLGETQQQCGWVKDKFNVSWQINPIKLDEMMTNGTEEQKDRVVQAFLKMKKFDIEELEKAFKGE